MGLVSQTFWTSRLPSCLLQSLLVPLVTLLKSITLSVFTWTFKVFLEKMLSANLNFLRFTLGKDPFREKNRKIFYEQYVFVGDEHVQKLQ